MTRDKIIEQAKAELKATGRPSDANELVPAWWVCDKILKHVEKALALLKGLGEAEALREHNKQIEQDVIYKLEQSHHREIMRLNDRCASMPKLPVPCPEGGKHLWQCVCEKCGMRISFNLDLPNRIKI